MKFFDKENAKVRTTKVYPFKEVRCDHCDKIICTAENKNPYFHFITGHNRWGNDSVDSISDYDLCKECAIKFVTQYIEEAEDTDYCEFRYEFGASLYDEERRVE